METLQAWKETLLAQLASATELPPLLHPNMANLWRTEITQLRDALTDDSCQPEAREAVRKMVEEIRLTPKDGELAIDVNGNLAAMPAAASPNHRGLAAPTYVGCGGGI